MNYGFKRNVSNSVLINNNKEKLFNFCFDELCSFMKVPDLNYLKNEEIIKWFDDQNKVNTGGLGQEEYDNFDNKTIDIDKHLIKILCQSNKFDLIPGGSTISVMYRSPMPEKDISKYMTKPEVYKPKDCIPACESYSILYKTRPKSSYIIELSAFKNLSENQYCFDQEGYRFLVDALAKEVILVENYHRQGCE